MASLCVTDTTFRKGCKKLVLVTGLERTLLTATAVAVCVYVRHHCMLHMWNEEVLVTGI